LPIARRSVFAWLAAAEDSKDPAKAAALSYDGSDYGPGPGEVRQDPYLARAWPSFEMLQQAGFERWLSLYRPLTTALLPTEAAA
jgi:exodeoxyribonuclease V gamma subunit